MESERERVSVRERERERERERGDALYCSADDEDESTVDR
jgi:hypothetical protein